MKACNEILKELFAKKHEVRFIVVFLVIQKCISVRFSHSSSPGICVALLQACGRSTIRSSRLSHYYKTSNGFRHDQGKSDTGLVVCLSNAYGIKFFCQQKMDGREYMSPVEFASDVRL